VATAGFTLISETLFLRKPTLALPMTGQFEQQLNGYMLDQLGYGKNVREIREDALGDFLYRIPDYAERLRDYDAADNSAILAKLDSLVRDDAALAREFHVRRHG
jgi:UDP:flavonoid glycosyltransferase YjiC (YdhE family)